MNKDSWKIWRHHDTERERQDLFRPGRDYRAMLGLMLIGIIIVLGLYFWLKRGLDNLSHSEATVSASSTTPRFTREDLTKYAGDLEARQEKFNSLQENPETFTDPSI